MNKAQELIEEMSEGKFSATAGPAKALTKALTLQQQKAGYSITTSTSDNDSHGQILLNGKEIGTWVDSPDDWNIDAQLKGHKGSFMGSGGGAGGLQSAIDAHMGGTK